jgi:geranylgeranyl pyrophosphate synthase
VREIPASLDEVVSESEAAVRGDAAAESSTIGVPIRTELCAAEEKLLRLLDSNEALISEICHYLVGSGGKRLRPSFILLAYRACGGGDAQIDDAIDAAIALELIHSATLLHDDIIDGGMLRRGKPSAYARYGLAASLVAGDYLFCRAFELCGRFEERLVHTAARACIQLTEGEVMEGLMRRRASANLADYLAIITRKTASLFSAGGRVAADLAGAHTTIIDEMEQLGRAVGLAFQMIDDLLDVLGPEEKIGKPVGSDLRLGVMSLPVVLGLRSNPELQALFNGDGLEGQALERVLSLLRKPEVIERGRAMAAQQVALARELLKRLPPSVYRDSLAILIDEQTNRDL